MLVWKGLSSVQAMWNSKNVGTEQEVHHTLCALLYLQVLEVFYLAMTQVISSSHTTLFNLLEQVGLHLQIFFTKSSYIGVISGALLYIRDYFEEVDKKTWLQVNSAKKECILILHF